MKYQLGKSYEELELGEQASVSKTITEEDVYLFARISGDFNPMHVDEEYARTTSFGARVAHGPLTQSLSASLVGMKLPGLGTIAVEFSSRFTAPVFFGDTITVTGEIVEKFVDRKWVRVALTWTNQKGVVVAEGSAVVSPPRKSTQ